MLETLNLIRKYTRISSLRKYTFQYQNLLNFADVGIFSAKKSAYFGKNNNFTQSNSVGAVFEIFLFLFSVFVRQKITINENVSFTDYALGIGLPHRSKLSINRRNDNDVTISHFFIFLVKFSYWSKFFFNIITGSRVITFFYKKLTRNPEIVNTQILKL